LAREKKWNGAVATIIENEYGIRRKGNPDYPGVLAELEHLDIAWQTKATEHEAACMMAVSLFCGYVDHGRNDEAWELFKKIMAVAKPQVAVGLIRPIPWSRYSNAIEKSASVLLVRTAHESNAKIKSSEQFGSPMRHAAASATVISCPICKGRVSRQEFSLQHCKNCGASFDN
jgi:hypothetical protein